jgi:Mg-chelatase subunit ChlD
MIVHKKPLVAKVKKTYVAFILDKSGSMNTVRDLTISAFNEQVQELRKNGSLGGETSISLIQFSGSVEETFFNVPIDETEGELDRTQYSPSGNTAMYDAIGYTLNKLQRFDEPGDVGFLVVILSDGQENSSRKYNGKDILSLKKELESTGRWTFQYIGCDASAIKDAVNNLGFEAHTYRNTTEGWEDLTKTMRYSFSNYCNARAAGHTSVTNFMEPNVGSVEIPPAQNTDWTKQ